MARYIGAKCRLAKREKTDLFLKSGIRPLASKCKPENNPGMHAVSRGGRISEYGIQLREKQKIKRIYGVLEKQFRNYYFKAVRQKGATGENILTALESRLDNVVYRMGFAATRSEARQMVSHKSILVNDKTISIASYKVLENDVISIREKAKKQLRIQFAIKLFGQREEASWVEVDHKKLQGIFKAIPKRSELSSDIQENLIVEFYSK